MLRLQMEHGDAFSDSYVSLGHRYIQRNDFGAILGTAGWYAHFS